MLNLFSNYHRWLSVFGIVFTLQVLELLLLQRKYDLFTGGFLQPFSYLSFAERSSFVALSLVIDITTVSVAAGLWFFIADKRGKDSLVASYNFLAIGSSVIGVWLAFKFKVLSYFSDTLNFVVIKNLGGGSLLEAFSYVTNEAAVFGIVLLVIVICYFIGLKIVKYQSATAPQNSRAAPFLSPFLMLLMSIFTIGVVITVNHHDPLRYGLSKKLSSGLISDTLNTLTDVDRDGFGLVNFPMDGDPFDSARYPGALDIPNNDVDEDGYAGDFVTASQPSDLLEKLARRPGEHIVLIVLESARGDLVGKRVDGELVAPVMTSIAEAGFSAPYAYSHTGFTTSSIKAILNRSLSNRKDRVSLPDFLQASGYQLSFLSGQDESFGDVAKDVGMERAGVYLFDARSALDDRVFPSTAPGSLRLSEERIAGQFKRRAEDLNWSQPQFIYVNLQAAHFPYAHPQIRKIVTESLIPRSDITKENRDWLSLTYWNAIANADWAIGEIVGALTEMKVYDDTILMILGDHGESLFDDGFLGHGHALNEAQTRIPLVINQRELAIEQAVGQIDVAEIAIRCALGQCSASRWANRHSGVFQFVGSLGNPQLIGLVHHGERRTILDLRIRKLFFSDLQRWVDFDDAYNSPKLNHRARELINTWETLRWQDQVAENPSDINKNGR